MINREDMQELTRRMTPARNCFDRIAGAYINDLGEVDETFNVHFGKLSGGTGIWFSLSGIFGSKCGRGED